MNKLLVLWILVLIPLANAEIFYQQGTNVSLKIPCINGGSQCSGTALCNISIINTIDGSYQAKSQIAQNLGNGDFQYNTTFPTYGDKILKLYCIDGNANATSIFSAKVTQSGTEGTMPEAILYFCGLVLFFVVFLMMLLFTINTDAKDSFSDDGYVLNINYNKYLKMGAFFASWLSLWIFSFLLWQTTYLFFTFPTLTDVVKIGFYIVSALGLPVFLIVCIWAVISIANNAELKKLQKRGVKQR